MTLKAVKAWFRTGLLLDHKGPFHKREDVQFIAHCLLILALLVMVRPLMGQKIPQSIYAADVILWEVISKDIDLLIDNARRGRPGMPRFLYLLVPTVFVWFSKRKLRWEDWEHGKSMRLIVMAFVVTMAYSTATFDYNLYLMRLHALDRLLVVGLAILSWYRPLAVPWAGAWMIIMIFEADVGAPTRHDDFDWRPLGEVLMVFSCFIWLSVRRTFKARHFLFLALMCWGSYYFWAGWAKFKYAQTPLHWIQENAISNFMIAAYIRGYLSFIPEDTWVSMVQIVRKTDAWSLGFTVAAEVGTMLLLTVHPRLARIWLLAVTMFNGGVAILAGVFFWKWMVVSLSMWWVLRTVEGKKLHKQLFKHFAIPLFAMALLWFASTRIYFYPQTRVFWWQTSFNEVFNLYAIGESGKKYTVELSDITPMQVILLFENFQYISKKRFLTGVYGNTGGYSIFKALNEMKTPEEATKLANRRSRSRYNKKRQQQFDRLFSTWFHNVNKYGKQHQWLGWLGRPDHVQIHKRFMDLEHELYDMQEKIVTIEVWNQKVFFNGEKIFRLSNKKIHTIKVKR